MGIDRTVDHNDMYAAVREKGREHLRLSIRRKKQLLSRREWS